jgi:very-short-patch-repair endonuclease
MRFKAAEVVNNVNAVVSLIKSASERRSGKI